jgi:hypothetical protein
LQHLLNVCFIPQSFDYNDYALTSISARFPQTICESQIDGVDNSKIVCEDIASSDATLTPIGGGPGKRQATVTGDVTAAGDGAFHTSSI